MGWGIFVGLLLVCVANFLHLETLVSVQKCSIPCSVIPSMVRSSKISPAVLKHRSELRKDNLTLYYVCSILILQSADVNLNPGVHCTLEVQRYLL